MSAGTNARRRAGTRGRRGFTLVELMLAGLVAAFVMGVVSMSLSQLGRAKTSTRRQLEAHLRADAALNSLRRDLVSVLRDPDLFWSRVLLNDDGQSSPAGYLDRDEILVYNTRLRPIRDLDFIGDGAEFETQFRVEEDDYGPVLWVRRDAVPDQYELGGGVATPIVNGIVSMSIEAFDGEIWYS